MTNYLMKNNPANTEKEYVVEMNTVSDLMCIKKLISVYQIK